MQHMEPDAFQAELDKREADKKTQSQSDVTNQSIEQAKKEVVASVIASTRANMRHRENTTTKVEVQNDLAETDDINRAVEAINNVAVLLLAQGQQKPSVNMIDGTDLGDRFNELGKTLTDLLTEVKNDTKQDESMKAVTKQLDTFLKQLKTLQVAPDPDLKKSLANVEKALKGLDMKPTVNVPAPKITVQGNEVDLSPLTTLLDKIATTLANLPTEKDDNTDVIAAISGVNDAIHGLVFPVANYVLPFKDVNGRAVQVQLDSSGNVPTSGSAGGGGTQYTDGSSTIAHPIGTIPVYDKAGTITAVSVANPLPVSATISTAGLATSANQTTEIASLATIAALSKVEDAPHTTGDTGMPMWAVRNDNGTVFAGSDGDYIPFATDATGALRVDLNGTVSTNNSTTVALAGNAAFTGTSEDALNYNEIRISVIASHASAADGLSIQQSEDNTNWDFTDVYTIPAATGKTYSVPRQARYFRIVYTNGATLQTSFRLQTIMNRLGARVSSQRPNDAYTNETDLEQTQGFLMGYNGATWDRLRTTGTGVLTTSTVLTTGAAAIGSLTAGSAIIGKVGIDQTTPGTTNLVALAANQSVNVAQINGVTPLMGNGVTGTGSPRVTIPSDNTAFSVNPLSATAPVSTMNSASANSGVNSAMAAVFDDTSPTAITENSFGFVRMSANRNQYTTIRDAAGNERGVNVTSGNAMQMDVTTVGTATVSTGNGASAAGVLRVAQVNDGTGVLATVTNVATIGTSVTPGGGAAHLGKAEDAAHTTGDTGVMDLGVRNDTLADQTNTNADYGAKSVDIKGRVMVAGAPRALKGTAQVSISASTSETTILAATASTFHDVYGLILANTGATTTKVSIRDDTAGTVRAIIEVPTLETRGFMLPVDSAMPQTAVNKNWTAQCGSSTTALEVTMFYVSMV